MPERTGHKSSLRVEGVACQPVTERYWTANRVMWQNGDDDVLNPHNASDMTKFSRNYTNMQYLIFIWTFSAYFWVFWHCPICNLSQVTDFHHLKCALSLGSNFDDRDTYNHMCCTAVSTIYTLYSWNWRHWQLSDGPDQKQVVWSVFPKDRLTGDVLDESSVQTLLQRWYPPLCHAGSP